MTKTWRSAVAILGAGALLGAIVLMSWQQRPTSVASRQPAGRYVGADACVVCHAEIAEMQALTGHARTFSLTKDSAVAQRLDGQVFEDPERKVSFHYRWDEAGLSVRIPESFGERSFPLQYALGSNHNAVTFVSLLPQETGAPTGIEHRVTVFGDELRLGLTPGHKGEQPQEDVALFGKILEGDALFKCIDCHVTTAKIESRGLSNLQANVSCERCHGPGEKHLAAVDAGRPAGEIEFGSLKTSGALRQIQMCGECHRLPDVLRPEDVKPENRFLARFQPVGLLNSKCYLQSNGQLGCTTCHNPHRPAAMAREEYVEHCLACHRSESLHQKTCPVSPTANCVECHMPPTEVHPGIRFHDHWIRVHKD